MEVLKSKRELKMIEIIKIEFHDTHFILNFFNHGKSDSLERIYATFLDMKKTCMMSVH